MEWAVGWCPPPSAFREVPKRAPGSNESRNQQVTPSWIPVLRLGGLRSFASVLRSWGVKTPGKPYRNCSVASSTSQSPSSSVSSRIREPTSSEETLDIPSPPATSAPTAISSTQEEPQQNNIEHKFGLQGNQDTNLQSREDNSSTHCPRSSLAGEGKRKSHHAAKGGSGGCSCENDSESDESDKSDYESTIISDSDNCSSIGKGYTHESSPHSSDSDDSVSLIASLNTIDSDEKLFWKGWGSNRCRFSPDGRLIAAAGADGTLVVWDAIVGRQTHFFPSAHDGGINDLSWHWSGKYIVTASSDRSVRVFGIFDSNRPQRKKRSRVDHPLSSAYPQHTSAGSTSSPVLTTTFIRHLERERWESSPLIELPEAHSIACTAVATPHEDWGGQLVLSGGYDGMLRLWDLRRSTVPGTSAASRSSAALSPSELLARGMRPCNGAEWKSCSISQSVTQATTGDLSAGTPRLSAESPPLISGLSSSTVSKATEIASFTPSSSVGQCNQMVLEARAHEKSITSIEISRDGRVCSTSSLDGYARLWRSHSFQIIKTLQATDGAPCTHACFSPNQRQLLCTTGTKTSRIWRLILPGNAHTTRGSADFFQRGRRPFVTTSSASSFSPSTSMSASAPSKGNSGVEAPEWYHFFHNHVSLLSYNSLEESVNSLRPQILQLYGHRGKRRIKSHVCIRKRRQKRTPKRRKNDGRKISDGMKSCESLSDSDTAKDSQESDEGGEDSDSDDEGHTTMDHTYEPDLTEDDLPSIFRASPQQFSGRTSSLQSSCYDPRGSNTPPIITALQQQKQLCCPFSTFWRDRALVPADDGCVHVFHSFTGLHEFQLPKAQHPLSLTSSVTAHPDPEVGVIATSTTKPDGAILLWSFCSGKQ